MEETNPLRIHHFPLVSQCGLPAPEAPGWAVGLWHCSVLEAASALAAFWVRADLQGAVNAVPPFSFLCTLGLLPPWGWMPLG